MPLTDIESLVTIGGTTIGIIGGLFGLFKYRLDKKETELREWQKVIIYTIFRRDEDTIYFMSFDNIRNAYLREAQAVQDINLKKKDISENALRRVLIDLTSSGILGMGPSNSFRLNTPPDPNLMDRMNKELYQLIGPNPNVYNIQTIAERIAAKLDVAIPLIITTINLSITNGFLVMNQQEKIAFPPALSVKAAVD